jgi:hypothetical protein
VRTFFTVIAPAWGVRTFFTVIQGHALRARRAVPALADSVQETRCPAGAVKVRKVAARSEAARRGYSAAPGRRPARGLWAVALRPRSPSPRRRPAPAGRRYQAATIPQCRASRNGRAVLPAPGSLSPRKITIKGAPAARRRCAAQTLDTDLPRQDLGTYQEDGERRGSLTLNTPAVDRDLHA